MCVCVCVCVTFTPSPQRIMVCPEEESILMTSLVDTLARLHGQSMSEKSEFDFEALRLDWFRLQTLTSVNKAALKYACVCVCV